MPAPLLPGAISNDDKKSRMKTDIEKLIDNFSAASQKHYRFTMTGESKKNNQQARVLKLSAKSNYLQIS